MQGKWEPDGQWRIDAASQLSPHQRVESYFSIELSSWRRWYLWQSACLLLLGLACLWVAAAPVAPVVPIETLLVLAGAATLVSVLGAKASPAGLTSSLPLALIPLATGAYLLAIPHEPPPNLGLVLAAYFAASGIAAILLAVAHRRCLLRQWEWLAVSGVASLIIAVLILSGLPGPFTWMFGVLLGVDFMFGGSAFLALALAADEVQLAQTRPVKLPSGSSPLPARQRACVSRVEPSPIQNATSANFKAAPLSQDPRGRPVGECEPSDEIRHVDN